MFGKNPGARETVKRIPKDTVGTELGVWKGDSTAIFLQKAKKIHAVDSWSPIPYESSTEWGSYENYLERYSEIAGGKTPEDFEKFYERIYLDVCNRFINEPVQIHRMTTKEYFKKTKANTLDWVYVDASHAYEEVLYDLKQCKRVVKKGGIIFGDDYSDAKKGVKDAVNSFIEKTGLSLDNFFDDQYMIQV